MISLRTLGLAAVAVVVVTGISLWQTGAWRGLVTQIPPLAQTLGVETPPAGESLPAAADSPGMNVTAPDNIVTWRDGNGVVHFTSAADAPPTAQPHSLGKAGTMADYEKALEEKKGVTAEQLYLQQQARMKREDGSQSQQ